MPEPSKAQLDHAQEVALRTGYKDGVSAAISGMAHKLSKRDHGIVDRWFLDIPPGLFNALCLSVGLRRDFSLFRRESV